MVVGVVLFAFFSWWAMSVGVKISDIELTLLEKVALNVFVIVLLILAGSSLLIGV